MAGLQNIYAGRKRAKKEADGEGEEEGDVRPSTSFPHSCNGSFWTDTSTHFYGIRYVAVDYQDHEPVDYKKQLRDSLPRKVL